MNKQFIYDYWSRTEPGRRMIASNNVSESELLFLIPNNIKKRHWLPLTRLGNRKKKRKYKSRRKQHILSYGLFDILEEIIEETLEYSYQKKFFNKFVDVKDLNIGDANIYFIPKIDDRPIKIVYENEYPCPVAYQLGFSRSCKHVDVTSEGFEMNFECKNIGCEDCFLERSE